MVNKIQSLYIHWPFCPYRCHFCPFVALAGHDQYMGQYHQALKAEIKQFAETQKEKLEINTIFFGGGTPSTYPDDLLLDMSGILKEEFRLSGDIEVTIEVNPGTVREEQLAVWKRAGINRFSIGVQSLNDKVLKNLNRLQQATDVEWLLKKANNEFNNISVDLILGLPGISSQEWKELIQKVLQWPITHISIYFLTVHQETPLYFRVAKQELILPDDSETVDLFYWTCDMIKQTGFDHYELSNFARPGYQSRHNSAYWERIGYKGFGIGACSFDGKHRTQNEKNIMKYMQAIANKTSTIIFSEELSEQQIRLEKLMLGLRRDKGIMQIDIEQDLSLVKKELVNQRITEFIDKGYLQKNGDKLQLTLQGLVIENQIITALFI